MYQSVLLSKDSTRAILTRSPHNPSKPRHYKIPQPANRTESTIGTKSYRDALQRSFNNAKNKIYFNPDMTHFVTLTYAGIEDDISQVMYDIKQLCKKERRKGNDLKYIYVLEWQQRGSLHVHMITNSALTTYVNKNGYRSLSYWSHGFTSMLTINDFDNNFKPYLYLFKYMRKAQRIGKTFVHSSRNLNNYDKVDCHIDPSQWNTINMEYNNAVVESTHFVYFKNYLCYDGTINSKENLQWLKSIKVLQFMKE